MESGGLGTKPRAGVSNQIRNYGNLIRPAAQCKEGIADNQEETYPWASKIVRKIVNSGSSPGTTPVSLAVFKAVKSLLQS